MALKIDITRTSGGRHLTPAVQTPTGNFGGNVERVQKISQAPVTAFGDTSGQVAIANSLLNAGNTFFDIARRERAMQAAEDDATRNRMRNEFNNREADIRAQLEQEQSETYRTPDEKYEEYISRVEQARKEVRGDYKFKTIDDSVIEEDFNHLHKKRDIEYRAGTIERDRRNQVKNSYAKSLSTYIDVAARAGREGDMAKFQQSLLEIGNLTSATQYVAAVGGTEAADLQRKGYTKDALVAFVKELANRNPQDARDLVDNADSLLMQIVSEEELSVIREDLQAIVTRETNEYERKVKKYQAKVFGQLDLGIVLGETQKNDILTANITEEQKAVLLRRIDASRKKQTTEGKNVSFVEKVLASGGSFAGTGKVYQGQVDTWWKFRKEQISEMPPEIQQQQVIADIQRVGIVPTELKLQLNGWIRNPDPQANQIAAMQVKALLDRAPYLVTEFTEDTQAFANLVDVGFTPEEAKDRVIRASGMKDVERAALKTQAKEQLKDIDTQVATFVEDSYDFTVFGDTGDTQIPAGLIADYRTLYTSNLIMTQDSEAAKTMTETQLKRLWYRTRVDGDRMMKYAPEREYNIPTEEIKRQLSDDLADTGLQPGDYKLAVDPTSLGYGKPKYNIVIVKDGMIDLLRDENNNIINWYPEHSQWLEQGKKQRDEILRARQDEDTFWKIHTSGTQ